MDFWQVVTIVLGSSALAAIVSGAVSIFVSRRTLQQQRDVFNQQQLTETTRLMLDLMATAHGAPTDGRTGIGVGQQITAIEMIATIGSNNALFSDAAACFLEDLGEVSPRAAGRAQQLSELSDAARRAHARVRGAQPVT